jgi:hypothetical protein
MALFGSKRDAIFLASINSELVNAVIDTEIEFFKLIVEHSKANIYGESDSKAYYDSVLIPTIITKDEKQAKMDDFGHTYTRTGTFVLSRDMLEKVDLFPEVGDIIFWDNEYYEIDNVDANKYLAGKNPETWPTGSEHGYSVSVICNAHATRQTPQGIKNIRRGGNNNVGYKGY